ncbi:MAG: DUF192 domain-containing protein [Armatimonadetes bacterium]|nr:DUF192 domain-containing protein [Armatimonadota bacterium]
MKPASWAAAVLVAAACGCSESNDAPPEQSSPPTRNSPALDPPPVRQSGRQFPLDSLQRADISVNREELRVYVVQDPPQQQEGLMYVKEDELGPDEGMIFVFPASDWRGFWMRNTPIPLDIAYLRPDGTIINVLTMRPYDESRYLSDEKAKYAVEARAGWFEARDVGPGDRFDLTGLPE